MHGVDGRSVSHEERGGVDIICREMISFIQAERGREGGGCCIFLFHKVI